MANNIDINAMKKWLKLTEDARKALLGNVFCFNCDIVDISDSYNIKEGENGDIVLTGICKNCGEPVARVVEAEWFEDED